MGTIAVTGSASGIGAATAARLSDDGHRVIGVDLRDADVIADLSTPEGRAAMVEGVTAACGGRLDGLVAGAGMAEGDPATLLSVNFFGAVATLEGLRPLLAATGDASAVAISSNSAVLPDLGGLALVEACLAGDEAVVRAMATEHQLSAYAESKLALARWVRRTAVTEAWIGAGIRLNAIAPGLIETPMTEGMMEHVLDLGDVYPIPVHRAGRASEVAGLLAYLLSPEAAFFCGTLIVMDGGTEAALRHDDWPAPRPAP